MPFKSFVLIALLVILGSKYSFADTFTVTSNADSGPGTLRDAIEKAAANGTAVPDYIYFNIPQPVYNLRIIDLVTELPSLSSNLLIDGSTQPGSSYGTTDAKICLRKKTHAVFFSMLKIENAQDVKIFGLQMHYGYWQGLFAFPNRSTDLYGVNIIRSSNIEIGAPGKGNVITGVLHGVYSNSDGCENIRIRSNYLGHGHFYTTIADDVDDVILSSECGITLADVKDIYIGGSSAAEGNIFGSRTRGINIDSRRATGNGLIRIQNNLFARGYDKVTVIPTYDFWDRYINVGRSRNNPISYASSVTTDYQVELLDNDIPNEAKISETSDSVIVLRNKFIYDGRVHGAKLNISTSGGGIIGGDDAANANYFLNKKAGFADASVMIYNSGPISIFKNIFRCNSTYRSTVQIMDFSNNLPFAQVDFTSATNVSGRATPDARIDLYYDDLCSACEGETYFATVQSDGAGKWTYTAALTGTVVATATKNGRTSMFSAPTFNHSAQKILQPVCGLNNGSITGITSEGAESYFWIRYPSGDTVSRSVDLLNAAPGEYILFAVHGGTCISPIYQSIVLTDVSPSITHPPSVVNPSCGLSNGLIYNMYVSGTAYSKMEWKDDAGQVIGDQVNIGQLPGGKYTFYITDLRAGCTVTSPTYDLVNQNGPSLDITGLQITPTTCGKANGSIIGLSATNITGAAFTQWVDASGKALGTGYSLLNVPAGVYRFKFKDESTCDTIIRPFTISALTTFNPISVTDVTSRDGTCDRSDGSIAIQSFSANPNNYTFNWIQSGSGNSLGSSRSLTGLGAGTYQLFATDNNGCESNIFTTTLKKLPKPVFDYTSMVIKDDQCNLQEGGITSISINGLLSPTNYAWFDETNKQVGGNSPSIQKLQAGTYKLQVTDGGSCVIQSQDFVIANRDRQLPMPLYTDLVISRHSAATLTVRNHSTGEYKLFTDDLATGMLQQNGTGIFHIPTVPDDKVYYIRQSSGTCYSPIASVSIKVVDKSYFTIPNAFTPNGDSKNDLLSIRFKGSIQLSYFRIYNRWGQLLFSTSNLNDEWNGTWKGILQPAGTYIWMGEGKDINGKIIKDRGNIILIR